MVVGLGISEASTVVYLGDSIKVMVDLDILCGATKNNFHKKTGSRKRSVNQIGADFCFILQGSETEMEMLNIVF